MFYIPGDSIIKLCNLLCVCYQKFCWFMSEKYFDMQAMYKTVIEFQVLKCFYWLSAVDVLVFMVNRFTNK